MNKLPELPNPLHHMNSYDIVLPVSKQKVKYRPFTIREQSSLLMANELGNEEAKIQAICNCLTACSGVDPYKTGTADCLWLYLKIRELSVGESVDVILKCEHCEKDFDTSVIWKKAEIKIPENRKSKIIVSNEIGFELMDIPFATSLKIDKETEDKEEQQDNLTFVANCIKSIWFGNTVYAGEEYDTQAKVNFIANVSSKVMADIEQFFNKSPYLTYHDEIECPHCKKKNIIEMSDVYSFFV